VDLVAADQENFRFKEVCSSPEAWQKMSTMPFSAVMSCFVGLTKIVASSTYSDVLIPLTLVEMGWTPLSIVIFRSLCKGP
jgi:hypothetical protein